MDEKKEKVETRSNSVNNSEELTINRHHNEKSKWYVLPSTTPISENEQSTNINEANQLKSIHKYLYTLILFFSYQCSVRNLSILFNSIHLIFNCCFNSITLS